MKVCIVRSKLVGYIFNLDVPAVHPDSARGQYAHDEHSDPHNYNDVEAREVIAALRAIIPQDRPAS